MQATAGVAYKESNSGANSLTGSRRGSLVPHEIDPQFQEMVEETLRFGEPRRDSLSIESAIQAKTSVKVSTPPENREHIKNLPTIKGLEVVCSFSYQGYSREHLEGFCKTIKGEKGVFGLRWFDFLGASLVSEGLKSKPKSVDIKSSDWGAQASRVPKNQALSKLAGKDPEFIREAQKKSEELDLPTVTLKLSKERIAELESATVDVETGQKALENKSGLHDGAISFTARPRGSNDVYCYKLVPDDLGEYEVYIELGGNLQPLEVYDFIPDYDIAFLSFEIATTNLGGVDRVTPFVVSNPTEHRFSLEEGNDTRGAGVLVEGYKVEGGEPQKIMDDVIGLTSDTLLAYLPKFNQDAGRKEKDNKPMFHHGAAFDYKDTELQSCLPMVLIVSEPFGAFDEQYYVVETMSQLRAVIKEMKNNKYFINASHFDELSDIHGESFTHYQRKITAHSTSQLYEEPTLESMSSELKQ
ncbi:hypothetical protein EOPP23_21270 [Endozoicomonas sp. OPT23]|nr:hypothetical protein [Endozoicomonas sp. OPT23]